MTPKTYNALSDGLDDTIDALTDTISGGDAMAWEVEKVIDQLIDLKLSLEAAYDQGEVWP